MQISFYPNFSRGFTLLEVLIVLFIVSLMTGIVVVSLPSFTQSDYFDRESQRIRVLIRMLSEEAVTQSNDYGLQMSKPPGFLGLATDVVRPETGLQAFNTLEEARNIGDLTSRYAGGDDSAYDEYLDLIDRTNPKQVVVEAEVNNKTHV